MESANGVGLRGHAENSPFPLSQASMEKQAFVLGLTIGFCSGIGWFLGWHYAGYFIGRLWGR